jgi:16S rRNA (guanine527-N7)-methyltransferase
MSMPDPPASAAQVLGRAVDERMNRYVDMLATIGVERGLIGPREAGRLWDRHILNCVVLEQLIPAETRLADLGSGAGLPGIVLALVRPDLQITLVEPLLRRATFLTEAIDALDLGSSVEVVRVRAEEYRGAPFTVVTARAVAPLDRLANLAFPMLTGRGQLLAMKGRRAHDEVREHSPTLARLGAGRVEVVTLGSPALAEPTTVVVVEAPARGVTNAARRGSPNR